MWVQLAYGAVILIWSTTPLAIKFSSVGGGVLFSLTSRMVLGALCCWLVVLPLRIHVPWHRAALKTYLAASVSLYGALLLIYWSALTIPSGLISVLYGLAPVITAVVAAPLLGERAITSAKVLGMGIGLAGLALIFSDDFYQQSVPIIGVTAAFGSVVLHALSAVLVKRSNPGLSGMAITTGALCITAAALVPTWWLFDGTLPEQLQPVAVGAILYTATVASVAGFALYYYVLRNLPANRVALITLVTPVAALLVGYGFNNEPLSPSIWAGAALIALAFVSYQWGDLVIARFQAATRGRAGS